MYQQLLWFLPPSVRPSRRDDIRRALLVVVGALLTVVGGAGIAAMQLLWGVPLAALASLVATAVAGALPFWIRHTGRWRVAAVILIAAVWVPACAVAILTGGAMSSSLYYVVFGAAMASLALGPRAGIALAALNAAIVGGIYLAHSRGMAPVLVVDAQVALESTMRGAFVFNMALAALVTGYEVLRAAAVREGEANERRFRVLVDQGPDLIAELNAAHGVVAANAGGAAFARSLADTLSGSACDGGIAVGDRDDVRRAFLRLDTRSPVHAGPLRWTDPALGRERWIEAALTRYHAGGDVRTLVVARDVSDRLAMEAQLRHSQKMQAVGELASGISHDVNNLLMVISGYSELLALQVPDHPALHRATAEIRRATGQGAALTRRLLGLASGSPGASRVLDLNAVVRDCQGLLHTLVGEGIALSVQAGTDVLAVRADPGELEQVLVNLVANARDALPPGGRVDVRVSHAGGEAVLDVRDNGPGMEPAVLERIFEPFFTTKPAGAGTGLGLFVVYSVVQRHGGRVHVASTPGVGTRVTIHFPVSPDAYTPPTPTPGSTPRGNERVLVVEDRPEIRSLIAQALESAGYQVVAAADGVEALDAGRSARVDLVVSDIVMPRMGGPALVAALRQLHPGLRALYISGGPPPTGEVAPTDRVLRKPFEVQELGRVVRDVLDTA